MTHMEMISVNQIAQAVSALRQDVEQAFNPLPAWLTNRDGTPRYRTDAVTGELLVSEEDQHYVRGLLYAVSEDRREARVANADHRLTAAYEALKAHPKLDSAPNKLAWESTMLGLFAHVAEALTELCDAKVDAKTLNPTRADRIRREARRLQGDAEINMRIALHKALRLASSH